jgi:excisionase family DNA binding protein
LNRSLSGWGPPCGFPRRLIEERRITFVKVGRHVRIPERAVEDFVTANTVAPVVRRLRAVA